MSRVRYAIVLKPSTSAGTSMCQTVPQPATGNSDAADHALAVARRELAERRDDEARHGDADDDEEHDDDVGQPVAIDRGQRAPQTPAKVAMTIARMPSVADTGKCSRMMSLTRRFCCVYERPKSPRSMLPSKIVYCSSNGLVEPVARLEIGADLGVDDLLAASTDRRARRASRRTSPSR